ncbi:MAG: hypothetical protein HOV80_09430 [Polyangiaceae bacterium]|nr:hypothetical protein [Polyangiaceae bacterium]
MVAPSQPPRAKVPFYKRALPFVVAFVLLGYVASQIDYRAFANALATLNYVPFLLYNASWCVALLAADTLGNFAVYRMTMPGVRWRDFFLYRGASYVPTLVNYHLGQGYLTYLMSKLSGVPLARMAGATLLMYATWMGCLLGCIAIALPFSSQPMGYVPLILGAGVMYLIVIAIHPKALARFTFLTPLFEAGLKGHAIALVARIPHLAVLLLGTWGSFFFFDVNIPAGTALIYLPIVLVATTLPIAPQGFGTREALSVLFFSSFAAGSTEAERNARVAACSTSWGVATTLFAVILGVICGRIVSRRLAALATT